MVQEKRVPFPSRSTHTHTPRCEGDACLTRAHALLCWVFFFLFFLMMLEDTRRTRIGSFFRGLAFPCPISFREKDEEKCNLLWQKNTISYQFVSRAASYGQEFLSHHHHPDEGKEGIKWEVQPNRKRYQVSSTFSSIIPQSWLWLRQIREGVPRSWDKVWNPVKWYRQLTARSSLLTRRRHRWRRAHSLGSRARSFPWRQCSSTIVKWQKSQMIALKIGEKKLTKQWNQWVNCLLFPSIACGSYKEELNSEIVSRFLKKQFSVIWLNQMLWEKSGGLILQICSQ